MTLRSEKTRTFGGKKFERAGQSGHKTKTDLKKWADFQRRVNNRNVRIVKENGKWEAYISTSRRK